MQQLPASAQRALDTAVEEFARATRFPLAFGGFESGGVATVTSLHGNRTLSLHGLRVARGLGLGGRAMHEIRPRLTADYTRSPHITHDYDGEVMAEQVMALFAVPVVLGGTVRAVLYGGTRGGSIPGTTFVQAGAAVASEFAREIRIEDEVTRRLAARQNLTSELPAALREELRTGHAELRRISASISDPELKQQLAALEQHFARIGSPTAGAAGSVGAPEASNSQHPSGTYTGFAGSVRLSPRELDVLSHAALGSTNAEIGRSLSLTEGTVKSYLKAAMSKLDASTRHAAVVAARRAGLIP